MYSTLPIDLISPRHTFFLFISPDEKCPQRETFCHLEEVKQKNPAEALKGIKIDEFKNCFE